MFAIFFNWSHGIVSLNSPKLTDSTTIELLGDPGIPLKYVPTKTGINVTLPHLGPADMPSRHAWVLKMTKLQNANQKPIHTKGSYRWNPINFQENDITKN